MRSSVKGMPGALQLRLFISKMESGNAVLQTIQSCENQRAYKLLKEREVVSTGNAVLGQG